MLFLLYIRDRLKDMKITRTMLYLIFLSCLILSQENEDLYKFIQTELIIAQKGDVISLPEGTFSISRSLWGDNLSNIKIEGKGIDKTILNFELQIDKYQ